MVSKKRVRGRQVGRQIRHQRLALAVGEFLDPVAGRPPEAESRDWAESFHLRFRAAAKGAKDRRTLSRVGQGLQACTRPISIRLPVKTPPLASKPG